MKTKFDKMSHEFLSMFPLNIYIKGRYGEKLEKESSHLSVVSLQHPGDLGGDLIVGVYETSHVTMETKND
jgi:hypothetical protein